MTCPDCGAERVSFEHYATGDWDVRYACGSTNDDNENKFRSDECKLREAEKKVSPNDRRQR